ncbi:hypothetical protein [Halalkalicoccus tibetensis]|uniref:HEPN domain-containing protein n=1 Tax=Halalkalicoccus tibetensis TaxID=175632 RepID=A0ABD5V230_9EURY
MREHAAEEMEKSRTALEDANTLREGGGSDEAIVNRLYYACFHAAQAVLYANGYDPSTLRCRHEAVRSRDRSIGRRLILGRAVPEQDAGPSERRGLRA